MTIPAEAPSVAPKVEMPKVATTFVKDRGPKPKEPKPKSFGARKTLESIAKGTPVSEAVAPKAENAPLPDRETVSKVLMEANQLLLDLKDMRVLLSALATQAADTPLGNEMRIDTLRMIGKMSNENMPAAQVIKLAALQKQIQDMKLPEPNPANSQLLQTITKYNESNPQTAVPKEITDKLSSGTVDSAQMTADILQSNSSLAARVWKDMMGRDNFSGLSPTPDTMLALTMVDPTPENRAKMQQIFSSSKAEYAKPGFNVMEKVSSSYVIGGLALMFLAQMSDSSGGGAGH